MSMKQSGAITRRSADYWSTLNQSWLLRVQSCFPTSAGGSLRLRLNQTL
ncbi:hypothetical protein LINGRAHAP2_LOCUS27972 [Linum grandiflorum]